MAAVDHPDDGLADPPASPRRRLLAPSGPAWNDCAEGRSRPRAGIEARRADSASIDTAFEAVERDAQTGGGVLAAAVAFRLFMFLVPYAFVMVTGFGLASTAAGQDPKDAARSAGIGGLLASAVANASTLSLANRLFALVVGGIALAFTARSFVRVLWIVHRLIWRVEPHRESLALGPADPRRLRHRSVRIRRLGGLARLAVTGAPGGGRRPDHRHLRRRLVPGFVVATEGAV